MTYNATLTVRKDVIINNYKVIKKEVGETPVAVMLKANAYGCGVSNIFLLLCKQGVKDFFVANLAEAIQVKECISNEDVKVYILHDIGEDNIQEIIDHHFIPVLNTVSNVKLWAEKAENKPCVIHFDSGINRLGASLEEIVYLKEEGILDKLDINYVISHFASSSAEDSSYTEWQYSNFEKITSLFPEGTKFSVANSGAIFKDKKYHLDMVRTGSALYGINPTKKENPLQNAIEIKANVLQIKDVKAGDKIGYNQTNTIERDGKIAIIGVGYADSILRSHSNNGYFYFGDIKLPILGAVSMDLSTVDITDVKDEIKEGDSVEILGEHQDLDTFGASGSTSGYEILTSLSKRYIWEFK